MLKRELLPLALILKKKKSRLRSCIVKCTCMYCRKIMEGKKTPFCFWPQILYVLANMSLFNVLYSGVSLQEIWCNNNVTRSPGGRLRHHVLSMSWCLDCNVYRSLVPKMNMIIAGLLWLNPSACVFHNIYCTKIQRILYILFSPTRWFFMMKYMSFLVFRFKLMQN